MKIVTVLPIFWHMDKKFYWKDIIQIWLTFKKVKWFSTEFWSLDKKNKWFMYNWIQWVWFKNTIYLVLNIIRNSRKIDLLHLYWIKRDTLLLMIIYKIFNKKWKIYIKADTALYKNNQDNRKILNKIPSKLFNIFINKVDYLWLENIELLTYFKNKFPKNKNKFLFLPCWAVNIKEYHNITKKNNIISLCWRFWWKEKNFELLIDSLLKNNIDILDWWKIQLIWDITNDFRKRLEILLNQKPKLKNIIEYKWFHIKKEDLYNLLIDSKLFIITSLSEWEPNVQFDSMFCWNYMLSTDVWSIKSNYLNEYSSFFKNNDYNDLYNKLYDFIKNENKISIYNYNEIQKHCIDNFIWEKSLSPLLNKF
jgi:hypothetical protein